MATMLSPHGLFAALSRAALRSAGGW